MPELPRLSGKQVKRAFERAGFREDRVAGSHCILKKDGHPFILSVPIHAGKTVGTGLLKSLIDAAGLTVEEFIKLAQ
jgi:predicted RNA binding protein YcfA (HicA-like mRNA interferase family)